MLLSFYCPQPTSDKLPVVRELPPPAVIYLVCRAPLGSGSPARSGSAKYPVYPKISCIPHYTSYPCLPSLPAYFTCLLVKNLLQKANPPKPVEKTLTQGPSQEPTRLYYGYEPLLPNTCALRIGYITHNPIKTIREDHPSQAACCKDNNRIKRLLRGQQQDNL
jgi:hypothetical protein